jgi:hypothetical protein
MTVFHVNGSYDFKMSFIICAHYWLLLGSLTQGVRREGQRKMRNADKFWSGGLERRYCFEDTCGRSEDNIKGVQWIQMGQSRY